jgi:Family of unknown function (DUF6152)
LTLRNAGSGSLFALKLGEFSSRRGAMKQRTISLVLVLSLFYFPMGIPLSAHHATAAQFDVLKTITIKGTVARINWSNPHVHIDVYVEEEQRVTEHWEVELGSPGAVIVAGLSKEAIQPGTVLTITGYPGKPTAEQSPSMPHSVCAKKLTLPDGTIATFVVGI